MASNVLIIIPAYNEQETIYNTVTALKKTTDFDYVVVNDGSKDRTSQILKENGFNHLDLPMNLGIGGAMQTGYKYALRQGYEYAIQLDADGQHDPRDLNNLVREIKQDRYDMVIGSRFVEKSGYKGSRMRRFGIFYFYMLIRLFTGLKVTDPTSGYRVVNRKVIGEFAHHYPIDYPEVEVIFSLARKKYRIKEIKVEMKDRQGGSSSITSLKSIYYMAKVTLFSLIRRAF
ncbi:glycosyltransferase family 2 protein [Aneurinibacillus tyrosinisolvens]|uniref:glycosyltransferase family 2 protein n=1 Tax=Aneurinibacillus tyrosinisolvens TaxID=1443435 RepID=UPI00063FCC71|nr:glycosyltransferase family 2 protein [Aneurinibacillus tyrosinisolvens]